MRMRGGLAGAVGLTLIALAAPAFGQSLFGVSLGDTEAQAFEALGATAKTGLLTGVPGKRVVWDGKRSLETCQGKVVSLQESIGTRLHDFAAASVAIEAREGPGRLRLLNDRTSSGEYSGVELTWDKPYGRLQVSYWQLGDEPPTVLRRISGPDPCSG